MTDADMMDLERFAAEAAITVSQSALRVMGEYLDGIIEKNQSVNLTRISDAGNGVRLHLIDSLLALPEVNAASEGVLLDLGSGGGFPGVPLCIASRRRGVLLDSVGKKSAAVNAVLQEVGLSGEVEVVTARAETLAQSKDQTFSVITARAVSGLPSLLELASPLLPIGGRFVALKGAPDTEELNHAGRVAALVGMEQVSLRECIVPGGTERRTIIAYVKSGAAKVKLPRRVGLAQKSPLIEGVRRS